MSATANSVYQAIALQHQAGNPPGAEYQRSNETFTNYFDRMFEKGLNPDINPTESDSDYVARLATYVPSPKSFNISASYALTPTSASYATVVMSSTSASWARVSLQSTIGNLTGGTIYYPTLVAGTGNQSDVIDSTDLSYNQATGQTWLTSLSASSVTASIKGTAIQLPTSASVLSLTPSVQTGSAYFQYSGSTSTLKVYNGLAWVSVNLT